MTGRVFVVGGWAAFQQWNKDNPDLRGAAVHVTRDESYLGHDGVGVVLLHDAYRFPVNMLDLQVRIRR